MRFEAQRFCKDFGIRFNLAGKNVMPGCVNVRCPFCDDPSAHLNINPKTGSVACWRCKSGSLVATIGKLLKVPRIEAERVLEDYASGETVKVASQKKQYNFRTTPLVIPGTELSKYHRKYLTRRGFDPDYLVEHHGIKGSGPMESWEGVDCRMRIIIPVYDRHGRLVTWQGRDISNLQPLRYKGCPIEKGFMSIKHTLYGAELAKDKRVVVVEGIFDQWRMGDGFVASYGTSMSPEQVAMLAKYWEEIIFLYDPEKEAQAKAMGYAKELSALGRKAIVVEADFGLDSEGNPRDCGDLSEKEAQELRLDLLDC